MDLVSAPEAAPVASEVAGGEGGAEVMNWSDTIAVDGAGGEEVEGGAVTHAMITADGRAVPVTYNEETGQYVTEDGQAVVVQGRKNQSHASSRLSCETNARLQYIYLIRNFDMILAKKRNITLCLHIP